MNPVWMIEGGATATDPVGEPGTGSSGAGEANGSGNLAERRFSALAAAVREHEISGRHQAMAARPQDLALYRRLRQICDAVRPL